MAEYITQRRIMKDGVRIGFEVKDSNDIGYPLLDAVIKEKIAEGDIFDLYYTKQKVFFKD